jgi:hypothetical protein
MPDSSELPEIQSLWIGPRLTWIELLSLHSWLAHGHRVTLWCYEPIEGVPGSIHTADASEILPKALISRYRATGSVSLFSNRFRYHLLQRGSVIWLDTDVVLLRPLAHMSPYLFGWEDSTTICSAVLRLPAGCPVLSDLVRLTGARVPVPGWWGFRGKLRQLTNALVGRHERAEDLQWGTFGPAALTYYLRKRDLIDRALPIDTFYPIHWDDISLFFATPDAVSSRVTRNTIGVHLWHSVMQRSFSDIKNLQTASPPESSWLGRMCERYEVRL